MLYRKLINSVMTRLLIKSANRLPTIGISRYAFTDNLSEYTGKFPIYMGEINGIGGISLSMFLGLAMITLKLWQLAELAVPMLLLLSGQVLLMFLYTYFVVFRVMGKDYDAAVICSGTCGFVPCIFTQVPHHGGYDHRTNINWKRHSCHR